MNDKERTWPAALVPDPLHALLFNVRKLDGVLVFDRSVERWIAVAARDAINQHYDWGAHQ